MIGILNVHRRWLANPILLGTWFAVGLVAFLINSGINWSEAPFKVFSLLAMLTPDMPLDLNLLLPSDLFVPSEASQMCFHE